MSAGDFEVSLKSIHKFSLHFKFPLSIMIVAWLYLSAGGVFAFERGKTTLNICRCLKG